MDDLKTIPRSFIFRRLHSFTGFFFVLFLMQHLFVNSQAALSADSFIAAVNDIQNIPYLHVIEIALLAVPICIHAIWGIFYAWEGKSNSKTSDGSVPSLEKYPRNHAYTWQRITAWLLLIAIAAHVAHMRFIEYPETIQNGTLSIDNPPKYLVHIGTNAAIDAEAKQRGVILFSSHKPSSANALNENNITTSPAFLKALKDNPVSPDESVAISPDFGTAVLLVLRSTFKIPLMLILYSLFVLTACFHAFNGLWTFLITWGVTISPKSQRLSTYLCFSLMMLVAFLGLSTIWGSYWITL